MNEFVRIVKCSHRKCIANDCVSLLSKLRVDFSCIELQLPPLCPPRVALSDGTGKSDIRTVSERYVSKCNTIENTLFHSEQIKWVQLEPNPRKLLHM